MSDKTVEPAKAKFSRKQGGGSPVPVNVKFFNPVSLQYSVANTLAQQGNGKQQYVSQSTAKLTMDLIFDTTDTGTDVRLYTTKMAALMEPGGQEGDAQRAAPDIVVFEWGTFSFQGMMESYKETIDFFAPEGVPLRASVNLTLSRQDKVFEADPKAGSKAHAEPQDLSLGAGEGLASLGSSVGSPTSKSPAETLRRIGAGNVLDSLRRVSATAVTIASSLPAASGAALGANLGLVGGNGNGSARSVRVGGALSAGVPASAGAFAGLRVPLAGAAASVRVNLDRLLPQGAADAMSVGTDADFRLGGRAEVQTGASFSADVGATASLSDELLFDE